MKSRKKSRRIDSYEKPKTVKQQVKFPYKRVRIDWIDIITEGGWGSEREFKNMKLIQSIRTRIYGNLTCCFTVLGFS